MTLGQMKSHTFYSEHCREHVQALSTYEVEKAAMFD
jgi:hypothetical protein